MKADFIKSSIITHLGYKGNLLCDEVGLPILVDWATKNFADVMEIKKNNTVVIYEVKSCINDFKSDNKWESYLEHCHLFYFVGDKETIEYIKSVVPKSVGLYIIHNCGLMQNMRKSKNSKIDIDHDGVRSRLNYKITYRYFKFWSKIKKQHKQSEEIK